MKVVTWNANMVFRNKHERILKYYQPDVLIVQECEHVSKIIQQNYSYTLWVGDNQNKGLAIFSKYHIEKLPKENNLIKYYIPFKIQNYFFIGIWAMNDKENKKNRYIGQVFNILKTHKEILNENIVIAGDFNWNIIWDKNPSYKLSGNFNDVLDIFKKQNIKSVYHSNNNEEFGNEKSPTLFLQRKKEKPYHVDYIFVKDKIKCSDFKIGNYSEWIDVSDHIPLSVTID